MSCRGQPISNRLCAAAWRKREQEGHRGRIAGNSTSSTIDDEPPKTYYLNINRAKKDRMNDEWCEKIDYENRLLLKKMTEIINTHTLDVVHSTPKRSLNEGLRKRELKKIMDENNAILTRITERKPAYSRSVWAAHQEKHDAYLENIRDKPMPSEPIPLPKFLRDGSFTERRPPHAYVYGNYSRVNKSHATQQPVAPLVVMNEGPRGDGSQSARQASPYTSLHPSSSSNNYHAYQPPVPNRTGVSKANNSAARVHQLQPMAPSTKKNPSASSTSKQSSSSQQPGADGKSLSDSPSGVSRMFELQAVKAGYTPILQHGLSLGSTYVILSVQEVPPPKSAASNEEKQDAHAQQQIPPFMTSSLSSSPPRVHSLLFRIYDPDASEDHSLWLPFEPHIASLPEVYADPSLLQKEKRAQLAEVMEKRLSLENGELKLKMGAAPAVAASTSPDHSSSAAEQSYQQQPQQQQQQQYQSSSYDPAPLPTPETHPVAYTDAEGVNYYYDQALNQYLPYPTDPVNAANDSQTRVTEEM